MQLGHVDYKHIMNYVRIKLNKCLQILY